MIYNPINAQKIIQFINEVSNQERMWKMHVRISFEVFGEKYYRDEKTYVGESIEDIVGLENHLLDFQKMLNEKGFKQVKK